MKTFTSLFVLGMLCTALNAQSIWTVDNNAISGAQFTSVQEAINAASPGDIIYVHPSSVAYGDILINKTIHIRGIGHMPELNNGERAIIVDINLNAGSGAPNSSFSGLEFSRIKANGNPTSDYDNFQVLNCRITTSVNVTNVEDYHCDNWLFQGCVFRVGLNDAIRQGPFLNWMFVNNYFETTTGQQLYNLFEEFNSSTVFRNNIVASNQSFEGPIALFDDTVGLFVENCVFLFNSGNPTALGASGADVTYNNCLTYSMGGGTFEDLPGSNNLNNVDPEFIEGGSNAYFSYDENYLMAPTSPAAGAGTDGQDLGIYGNSIEFSMEGYPIELPYPTEMMISTTQVPNGGTLNVQFKARGN